MFRRFSGISRVAMVLVPAALVLGASAASAGNVGVDLNLHLGNQPQQVVVPVAPQPAPVVVREPAPPAVVAIDNDFDFVYPAQLGFYVAVGVPYDLFYVRNNYYLFRDGVWLRAPGSHGPWSVMRYRELPPGLRKNNIERIRAFRRAEYETFRQDRDHYRGKHFMTRRDDWKEQRKAEKERFKEARREEKDYRKEMKRAEKEERKRWKHDND